MIKLQRVEDRETIFHENREFTLVAWTWTMTISGPALGVGWRYHQPRRVESTDGGTSVYDHVFLARTVAALVLIVSALIRRRENE